MRVSVTQRRDLSAADLRSAGEAAPSLAFPWVAKLRYGLLAGECALILAAHYIFGVELPILWLALPVAVAALGNPLLERFTGAFRDRRALGILLTLDTLCLTALLSLTGGPANPFTLLYLVQITLSAVILSKEWTWVIGGLSVAGYAFLFPVHVRVPVFESHHTSEGFSVHLAGMWIAFAAAPLGTIAVVSKDLELYAERELGNGEVATEARLIRSEVDRCRGILQQMSIRGAEPLGETPVPLGLGEALGSVKQGFALPERELVRTEVAGEGQEVTLPPDATRQALTALVRNALDASDGSHPVLLTAECAQGKLRFTVEDSGCGMRRETLDRVAQPFFTTKPPGRGMGLGTFLVRAYAEALNGSLEFESEAGAGTKVTLDLPLPWP